MKLIVNGEEREFSSGLTVRALLEDLGAPRTGIAVAKNDRVVRRAEFETHELQAGDRVEIIRAVAGG